MEVPDEEMPHCLIDPTPGHIIQSPALDANLALFHKQDAPHPIPLDLENVFLGVKWDRRTGEHGADCFGEQRAFQEQRMVNCNSPCRDNQVGKNGG